MNKNFTVVKFHQNQTLGGKFFVEMELESTETLDLPVKPAPVIRNMGYVLQLIDRDKHPEKYPSHAGPKPIPAARIQFSVHVKKPLPFLHGDLVEITVKQKGSTRYENRQKSQ